MLKSVLLGGSNRVACAVGGVIASNWRYFITAFNTVADRSSQGARSNGATVYH